MKNEFSAIVVRNSLLMGADFYRPDLEITEISPKMTSQIEHNGLYSNGLQASNDRNHPNSAQHPNQFYFETSDGQSTYYSNGLNAVNTSSSTTNTSADDRYTVTTDSVSFTFIKNIINYFYYVT